MFKKIATKVSRKNHVVSLSFITKEKMRKINNKYRKKNRPTDVLSFNMNEGKLLGDIFICPSLAKKNARSYGVTYKSELARLLVHGLLHLLGYDHGPKMFDLQDNFLKGVCYA